MYSTRQFKLINPLTTEEFDFSADLEKNNVFFSGPTGLGFNLDKSYGSSVDGFYVNMSGRHSQGAVAGTLIFTGNGVGDGNPYTTYSNFMRFISSSSELQLAYAPGAYYDIEEGTAYEPEYYYADCEVTKLEKSEISKEQIDVLMCSVEFTLTSPWARRIMYDITLGANDRDLLYPNGSPDAYSDVALTVYPGDAPATYEKFVYSSQTQNVTTFEFSNNSPISASYIATVSIPSDYPGGTVSDPKFVLRANGKEISSITIETRIAAGSKITISTRPNKSYIRINDADATQYINIETNPFGKPEPGNNSFTFIPNIAERRSMVGLTFTLYEYYWSV